MVDVAQVVRALDCGSRGRGFESHPPPCIKNSGLEKDRGFFIYRYFLISEMKFVISLFTIRKQRITL